MKILDGNGCQCILVGTGNGGKWNAIDSHNNVGNEHFGGKTDPQVLGAKCQLPATRHSAVSPRPELSVFPLPPSLVTPRGPLVRVAPPWWSVLNLAIRWPPNYDPGWDWIAIQTLPPGSGQTVWFTQGEVKLIEDRWVWWEVVDLSNTYRRFLTRFLTSI